jgi:hypothetical protein
MWLAPRMDLMPFVQITYDVIRVGPDGNELALYRDGDWQLIDQEREETAFSDAIIYG